MTRPSWHETIRAASILASCAESPPEMVERLPRRTLGIRFADDRTVGYSRRDPRVPELQLIRKAWIEGETGPYNTDDADWIVREDVAETAAGTVDEAIDRAIARRDRDDGIRRERMDLRERLA